MTSQKLLRMLTCMYPNGQRRRGRLGLGKKWWNLMLDSLWRPTTQNLGISFTQKWSLSKVRETIQQSIILHWMQLMRKTQWMILTLGTPKPIDNLRGRLDWVWMVYNNMRGEAPGCVRTMIPLPTNLNHSQWLDSTNLARSRSSRNGETLTVITQAPGNLISPQPLRLLARSTPQQVPPQQPLHIHLCTN